MLTMSQIYVFPRSRENFLISFDKNISSSARCRIFTPSHCIAVNLVVGGPENPKWPQQRIQNDPTGWIRMARIAEYQTRS